ncbi:RNA-binding S4 domain-containing protein [Allobranchiibius sp. GilTou38]|uniref:RNA-binding S4 domain-containing protein n=1 Tax=Allobranchiibius sp. GilTou38 TaxID=2815210 RepID=UPI001AA0D006|nr:RNA-binding S4 domain-containing protein [Allobranchiibius sp. GilTou38]MBO1768478.1 RNA-binding S4 domain-containing protein [Allobranchiibius sp. GilTou38]
MSGMTTAPLQVPIRDASIRLGQLLKLAGVVQDGAQARALIQGGEVLVDGQVETRRARAVPVGAVVRLGDVEVHVVAG